MNWASSFKSCLPIHLLLAKMLDFASVWALMSDSSILRYVWSPLAPIHVALRPWRAPTSIHCICKQWVLRYPNYISSESLSRFYGKYVRSRNFIFGIYIGLAEPKDQNSLPLSWIQGNMFHSQFCGYLWLNWHKTIQEGWGWVNVWPWTIGFHGNQVHHGAWAIKWYFWPSYRQNDYFIGSGYPFLVDLNNFLCLTSSRTGLRSKQRRDFNSDVTWSRSAWYLCHKVKVISDAMVALLCDVTCSAWSQKENAINHGNVKGEGKKLDNRKNPLLIQQANV